jgi:hypothetical protein
VLSSKLLFCLRFTARESKNFWTQFTTTLNKESEKKMANTDYDLDKDLEREMVGMVADETLSEFGPLRDLAIVILSCVKVRMNKDGETEACSGDPVAVKKVGPAERLFMPKKPHFIVSVDYGTWDAADERQRKIIVHRALMRIAAEKTDEGMKVGMRKPDILEFTTTVARFGAYNDPLLTLREAFRNSAHRLIPQMEEEAPQSEESVHEPEPQHG